MEKDEKSSVVRGPWTRSAAYNPELQRESFGQAARRARLLKGEPALPHDVRAYANRQRIKPKPWIRTKKNGAKTSKLGINTMEAILLMGLALVLVIVAAGYQFYSWGWL